MPFYLSYLNIFYLILNHFYKEQKKKQLNYSFVKIGYFFIYLVNILIISILNFFMAIYFYAYKFVKIF